MTRVLIVDDAMFMRKTIKRILEGNGYDVVAEAENGYQALSLFEQHRPDIISLDITMPELDGLETLEKLRQINPKAKVVMVTAVGQEKLVREAIKLGAASFLVKPFNEVQLINAFHSISKRQEE